MKFSQIMIVEDEPIIARDIKNNLEQSGYTIPSIASSSIDAISKIKKSRPDLILMDIKLNEKTDGIDLVELINDKFEIPVIYLTAYSDKQTLDRALQTTPYGYLIKPINIYELQSTIETALRISKQSNQKLHELNQLKTIFNKTTVTFITTDKNFRIISHNTQLNKTFGYTKSLLGKNIQQLIKKKQQHDLINIDSLMHKDTIQKDIHFIAQDGTIIKTLCTIHVIKYTDAIEELLFEIYPQQNNKNQSTIYDEALNAMANTSHEIRTPINAIIGYSDLMQTHTLDENLRSYISHIKESAQLILTLTNDILDQSKIESGEIYINPIPFSLIETLHTITTNSKILISQYNKTIDITFTISNKIAEYIIGDPIRLQQVLNNLLNNAIKFTDTGHITIDVSIFNDTILQFSVKDTGIGICPEQQEYIFEKFARVNKKSHGSGLGLYITKKIIEKMGGSIKIKSNTDYKKGTEFIFTFMYISDKIKNNLGSQNRDTKKKLTILLVEDDRTNQVLLNNFCNKLGYNIIIASTAQESLNLYKKDPLISLILMDIQLPGMNGTEATRNMRQYEKINNLKETPIIAITATTSHNDIQDCLAAGCCNYLQKPVLLSTLKSIINRYISSA